MNCFNLAISYANQCDLYAISAPSDVNMLLWIKVVVLEIMDLEAILSIQE